MFSSFALYKELNSRLCRRERSRIAKATEARIGAHRWRISFYNYAIRRIFSSHRWESIKTLRESFGYQSITEIFAERKARFEAQLPSIGNQTLLAHI